MYLSGTKIFGQPVKNKQEVYEKLVKMSRNAKILQQETYAITHITKIITNLFV